MKEKKHPPLACEARVCSANKGGTMKNIPFSLEKPIRFKYSGLFKSKNSDWIHMRRELIEYQLIIVVEGTLHIADKKQTYHVSEGEYLIMSPGLQYGTEPSACSFYWLHFESSEEPSSYLLPNRGTVSSMQPFSTLFSLLTDATVAYKNDVTSNHHATSILLELYNQIKQSKISGSSNDYLYQKIMDYINWNQSYQIKVKEMAAHLGYHPKYLSTFFKNETGMTLKQYLVQQTMELAKNELTSTNHSIQNIAMSLGFCDSHAFSYAFHQTVGVSPREYRKAHPGMGTNSN